MFEYLFSSSWSHFIDVDKNLRISCHRWKYVNLLRAIYNTVILWRKSIQLTPILVIVLVNQNIFGWRVLRRVWRAKASFATGRQTLTAKLHRFTSSCIESNECNLFCSEIFYNGLKIACCNHRRKNLLQPLRQSVAVTVVVRHITAAILENLRPL